MPHQHHHHLHRILRRIGLPPVNHSDKHRSAGAAKKKICDIADPAPLGLFGFALTTFVLSCYNAGILGVSSTDPINVAVTLGIFYGGGSQFIAGMWEFLYGDTFSATAFTSYGAFWLSYAALFIPSFGVSQAYSDAAAAAGAVSSTAVYKNAKAIYLLGWTIFTFIMLVGSSRISVSLCFLFSLVAVTLTVLTAAEFSQIEGLHRAGGFLGMVTSVVAWYNALAELLLSQENPVFTLPLGKFASRSSAVEASQSARSTSSRVAPLHSTLDSV